MLKSELIRLVAQNLQVSNRDATKTVNLIFQAITEKLEEGEKVTIAGFGTFIVRNRQPYRAINPSTLQKINVPARKRVVFVPGSDIRKAVKTSKSK